MLRRPRRLRGAGPGDPRSGGGGPTPAGECLTAVGLLSSLLSLTVVVVVMVVVFSVNCCVRSVGILVGFHCCVVFFILFSFVVVFSFVFFFVFVS